MDNGIAPVDRLASPVTDGAKSLRKTILRGDAYGEKHIDKKDDGGSDGAGLHSRSPACRKESAFPLSDKRENGESGGLVVLNPVLYVGAIDSHALVVFER